MERPSLRVILEAVLPPLLIWVVPVVGITWLGDPGVACMTPLAWILAVLVGQNVEHDSPLPMKGMLVEAGLGGALLGFWQGALFAAVMAVSQYVDPRSGEPADVIFTALLALCLSMPVTTLLAVGWAWFLRRRKGEPTRETWWRR